MVEKSVHFGELPDFDDKLPKSGQGLYRKFDVRRVDGSDAKGKRHHGCSYFVLDVTHDPFAAAALDAYADACDQALPALAADLRKQIAMGTVWDKEAGDGVGRPAMKLDPEALDKAFDAFWDAVGWEKPRQQHIEAAIRAYREARAAQDKEAGMVEHDHGEAYKLMGYRCACGHQETIWNSRDGVTPFSLGCPSCGQMTLQHINWRRDIFAPNHKLHRGQRYFRDGTSDEAEKIMCRRIERMTGLHPLSPDEAQNLIAKARSGELSEFQRGWPMLDRHTDD